MIDVATKKVCVVGLGYIGLPTAILAAQHGYDVVGFDVDHERIAQINNGISPLAEPEIEMRLQEVVARKKLRAYDEAHEADYFIVAVPTPFKQGYKADLSYVFNAGTTIARVLTPGAVVILESTVPVGTSKRLAQLLEDISGLQHGEDFFVAHCPERVLPGKIFYELVHNNRVIGGVDEQSALKAREFYQAFVQGEISITSDAAAEMVKLIENSSRDVQIAFANQVAGMCEQADVDVHEVIKLANRHPRVHVLSPGCGVGGHCIAVDPWFLIESFPQSSTLLKAARTINDARPHQVLEKVLEAVQNFRDGKRKKTKPRVLVLGLTYKPDIDDLRESPALKITQELMQRKAVLDLLVCEPHLSPAAIKEHGIGQAVSLSDGIECADIVVVLVKHTLFLDIKEAELKDKVVIDTCGLQHSLHEATQRKIEYTRQRDTITIIS